MNKQIFISNKYKRLIIYLKIITTKSIINMEFNKLCQIKEMKIFKIVIPIQLVYQQCYLILNIK